MELAEALYDLEWDSYLGCWVLHFASEAMCMGNGTFAEAEAEAELIIKEWV